MGTIVKSVYDALVSEVSTELGSEWQQLHYFLDDIEQNNSRNIVKGFGVIPGQALTTAGIVKAKTFDQNFTIVLTEKNTRENSDDARVQALLTILYDKADDIHDRILHKQLGIPSIIINVFQPSMNDPEYLDSFIVLRLGVVVKYRKLLT